MANIQRRGFLEAGTRPVQVGEFNFQISPEQEEQLRQRGEAQARKKRLQTSLEGSQSMRGEIRRALAGLGTRGAPQAELDPQFQQAQLGLLSQLQGLASGEQATAGELAIQRAANRSRAAQQSLAATARGGNAALAQRLAARQSADIGTTAAGQQAEARLQGQRAAQDALGQVIGQNQQLSLANLNAQLQARGLDDQSRIALLSQLFNIDSTELQARLQQQQLDQQNRSRRDKLLGSLLQVGGAAVGGLAGGPVGAGVGANVGGSLGG